MNIPTWWRTRGRRAALEKTLGNNPDNAVAARELATLFLDAGQAARAEPLLAVVAGKHGGDGVDVQVLRGRMLLGVGRAAEAVGVLSDAARVDDKAAYGAVWLYLGDALLAGGQPADAASAYERFSHSNTSTIEGYVKLGRARRAVDDKGGAERAFAEGRKTFFQLPAFRRKGQWLWWFRSLLS
jgi:predicted Zn-dependent protease